jgi:hypothetical protein
MLKVRGRKEVNKNFWKYCARLGKLMQLNLMIMDPLILKPRTLNITITLKI